VIVSHANILANMEMIKLGFSHDEDTVVMGWLPFTHDMGLVGIMLQPFYLGVQSILLPPMAFVRRPARWLQLISEYRVTTSGAPDFAYAMCVRRVTERDLEGVDLSSWTLAFSGAETVRSNSLVAFAEKFGPYGFSPRAFYPCYGLAEATLFVTGPQARSPLRAERVPASSLEAGTIAQASAGSNERVRELISCGRPWSGLRLVIADPETLQKKPAGEVGEILVGGPSVTGGYWENPEQTAHAFGRYTADGDGPFLRTGDLGFIADGELFVTGRIKDLMIISGKNHYPQDIELTSSESDPVFSGRPAAAFVLSDEDDEAVVLVQEVPKAFAIRFEKSPQEQLLRELKAKIRNAVTREHGVALKRIVLVPQGALPMTTSGKIRRSNSRQLLVNNQLKEVGAAAQTA
jgi:acyl-CoA synthetase (AMP-forming)/AMP-acid ligase II